MNSSRSRIVKLPADLRAEMDSIKRITQHPNAKTFTAEEDAVITELMSDPCIMRSDVYVFFKKRFGWGCGETLRKRYKELTNGN